MRLNGLDGSLRLRQGTADVPLTAQRRKAMPEDVPEVRVVPAAVTERNNMDDGLIRISYAQLIRMLHLRGKPPGALREAGVAAGTLAKIRQGLPVQARILRKIVVQLAKWPVLEGAAELLSP